MKIRTRVRIAGGLTVFVLLVYGSLVLHLDRAMSTLAEEVRESNEIVNEITMLRNLTLDYLLYRTERAQKQWTALYDEMVRLFESPHSLGHQKKYDIGDAPRKLKIVGDTFSKLMTIQQAEAPGSPGAGARSELQSRLATQLLLATQDLLTRFFSLTEAVNGKLIATQRLTSILDIMALAALAVLLISNAIFLQRSVVKPVLGLHEGAEIIGAGNLDHKMGMATRDEIGQLSRAFDQMTLNLKNLTVSLKKSEESLRSLTSQLLTVQEEERSHLSRELHDDLGQALLVLRMQLNAMLKHCSPDLELCQRLKDASHYLLGVINRVRRLSRDLSPSTLENFGLSAALEDLFEEFQKYHDHGVVTRVDLDEVKDILPQEANIVIYRVAQEFLSNVHKHAEATQVSVDIKALPEKVTVTLEDNGKGFDLEEIKGRPRERRGLGVPSMEERIRMLGSQISMSSQAGRGTRLYFEIQRPKAKESAEVPVT